MVKPDTTYATILVVDDMPENIGVLFDFLTQHNFRVLVARDGEDALRTTQKDMPDLILLDVMMPGFDGFETCRRLKDNPVTTDIPIIFMTALTETENKVKAFASGGVDYITKPFQHKEVLARVLTQLQLQSSLRQLQQQNAEKEELNRVLFDHARQLEEQLTEFRAIANIVNRDLKQPLEQMGLETHPSRIELLSPEQSLRHLKNVEEYRIQMLVTVDEVLMLAGLRTEMVITTPLNIQWVIHETLHRFEYLLQRTSTQLEYPPSWPTVIGHAPWISRVWQTLLAYSLQNPGTPSRIQLGYTVLENGYVRFWQEDNGPALSAADRQVLFNAQGLPEECGSHELSFFVARKIIEKYGGELVVEAKSHGNLFSFSLPQVG